MRASAAAVALIAALTSAGCWFKKTPPSPTAPPPVQRPPVEIKSPKTQPPPPLEAPKVELPAPQPPPAEPTVIRPKLEKVQPPAPPPSAAKKKRPATKAAKPATGTPVQPPQTEAAASDTAPAAPPPLVTPSAQAPQLGEVLPDDKRKAYLASIDADLGSAQRVLREVEGRTLNRDQVENVNRIKAFIRQAGEARSTDISAAMQLARRAAILSEELLKTLE